MRTTRLFKQIISTMAVCLTFFVACSDGDSSYSFGVSGGEGSGNGGSMARFAVSGNYLYTVNNQMMMTFDISDAAQPEYLPQKDQYLRFGIETVFTKDTLLFIGSQNGMYIYNISRPDFPQQLSVTEHIRSSDPVAASGKYAYVTLNSENTRGGNVSNRLEIYNISDPYAPYLVRSEAGFLHPRGLGVDNDKLFICDNGLKVYNLSNPERPIWIDDLSRIPEAKDIDAYDVIPLNGLLLVTSANGLYQFDYTGERLKYISKIEVKTNLP